MNQIRVAHGMIAFLALLVGGCNRQPESRQEVTAKPVVPYSLSASATAEKRSDGTISVRDTTSEELAGVSSIDAKLAPINKLYPAEDPPQNGPRLKAVRVTVPGLIYFKNAPTVRIDGISCSQQGIERISKAILSPSDSVVILPSGTKSLNPLPAVVWTVFSGSDKWLGAFQMFSSVADLALMNNWCVAEHSPTSKYNDRYTALAKAFSLAKSKKN
jgi:hypothetical protein